MQPHGLQPARLLCPWDSSGKNTGVVAIFSSRGSSQPRDRNCVSWQGDSLPLAPPGKPSDAPGVAPKSSRDLAWTCVPTHHSLPRSDSVSGTLGRLSVLLWNYGNLSRSFPITKTTQEQGMLCSLLRVGTWPGIVVQLLSLSLHLLDVEKSKPFPVFPGLTLTWEFISPNTSRNFIKKHIVWKKYN